jgi:YbbR domain-containing protein
MAVKKMSKIFAPIIWIFKILYKIIDFLIVTPISKIIYRVRGFLKDNNSRFEKILNRPNILIYVSLVCAIVLFFLVDRRVINLTEKEAEVIEGQKVNVIYNYDAYVVEGVPETVDITLIGSKSSIYLATQLGEHEVDLDLSGYGPGTYKVPLKYNHSVESVTYKLDPATITVKISEKVSDVEPLTYDLLNQNKLDKKLSVSKVILDSSEVIAKSSQENLNKIATVKALIDTSKITLKESGTQTLEDIELVAYDDQGNRLVNVEVVPSRISAQVTIDSYHINLPVKTVITGNMASGKAIASITSSVKNVDVYGDKDVLDKLTEVQAKVDVEGLDSNKQLSVDLIRVNGVRYMTETKTNINITVGQETQREVTGIIVSSNNLGSDLTAQASSSERTISVILKGTQEAINSIPDNQIYASVDLTGLGKGSYSVPVVVTTTDERVIAIPTKTEITVNIH